MAFLVFALLGAPEPASRIIIDRHVHKTGGTTVRTIFHNAADNGECMYWGYSVQTRELRKVVEALRSDNATVRGTRLCVEQHMADDVAAEHAMLQELRASLGAAAVYQTTRVREPLAYYLSYFKWAIVGNKLAAEQGGRGDASLGAYFLEWAPTNLQVWLLPTTTLCSPPPEPPHSHTRRLHRRLHTALNTFTVASTAYPPSPPPPSPPPPCTLSRYSCPSIVPPADQPAAPPTLVARRRDGRRRDGPAVGPKRGRLRRGGRDARPIRAGGHFPRRFPARHILRSPPDARSRLAPQRRMSLVSSPRLRARRWARRSASRSSRPCWRSRRG